MFNNNLLDENTINYNSTIPIFAPKGNYDLTLKINDKKTDVGCIDINTDLKYINI